MDTLLTRLKVDLGILSSTAYDARLQQYIASAINLIMREGVLLLNKSDPADAQLIVMYAAWLWRRRDTMEGMPKALRVALNDRKFREAVDND